MGFFRLTLMKYEVCNCTETVGVVWRSGHVRKTGAENPKRPITKSQFGRFGIVPFLRLHGRAARRIENFHLSKCELSQAQLPIVSARGARATALQRDRVRRGRAQPHPRRKHDDRGSGAHVSRVRQKVCQSGRVQQNEVHVRRPNVLSVRPAHSRLRTLWRPAQVCVCVCFFFGVLFDCHLLSGVNCLPTTVRST